MAVPLQAKVLRIDRQTTEPDNMRSFLRLIFLYMAWGAPWAGAFSTQQRNHHKSFQSPTRLSLTEAEIPAEAMYSRGFCLFWFFGASGAAGIGRAALPRQIERYIAAQKLKGVGPTKGGPTLGLPTSILGYPEDICIADINQVINNSATARDMVAKYPVEGDYLASKGYLNILAFELANANAIPLAVRAVFDSFAENNDNVNPDIADKKLNRYKEEGGLEDLKTALLVNKAIVWSGFIVLLFLLGIADIFAFSDLYAGWFPDWPGGKNFPMSVFTEPDGSPFKILDYWI